jgi:mono/diheme cytochrome c family protein
MRLIASAILFLVLGTSLASATEPSGSAASGQKFYIAKGCYECHGTEAQGSSVSGPRLAPPAPPYEAFLSELRHPMSDMPPYGRAVLSDRDAADIYAFLKTIKAPPDPGSLPLLK